jgi:hypothetical protein
METAEDEYEQQHNTKQKIQTKGSGVFHILPAKLNCTHSFNDNVDGYFETRIDVNNTSEHIQCKYKTFFRGRGLYGNKYNTNGNANVNMTHYELVNDEINNTNTYVVNKVNDINEYYLWKYDENIPMEDEVFNNIDEFISKLSVLN